MEIRSHRQSPISKTLLTHLWMRVVGRYCEMRPGESAFGGSVLDFAYTLFPHRLHSQSIKKRMIDGNASSSARRCPSTLRHSAFLAKSPGRQAQQSRLGQLSDKMHDLFDLNACGNLTGSTLGIGLAIQTGYASLRSTRCHLEPQQPRASRSCNHHERCGKDWRRCDCRQPSRKSQDLQRIVDETRRHFGQIDVPLL